MCDVSHVVNYFCRDRFDAFCALKDAKRWQCRELSCGISGICSSSLSHTRHTNKLNSRCVGSHRAERAHSCLSPLCPIGNYLKAANEYRIISHFSLIHFIPWWLSSARAWTECDADISEESLLVSNDERNAMLRCVWNESLRVWKGKKAAKLLKRIISISNYGAYYVARRRTFLPLNQENVVVFHSLACRHFAFIHSPFFFYCALFIKSSNSSIKNEHENTKIKKYFLHQTWKGG